MQSTTKHPSLPGQSNHIQSKTDPRKLDAPDITDTTYWGILCRTCRDLVAFDMAPYPSFGPRAATFKPGAIRCSQGHNHIYFPGDFHFHRSDLRITAGVMEQNRAAYRAINPHSPFSQQEMIPTKAEPESVPPPKPKENLELHPNLPPDPNRESAQMAARHRWAEWFLNKMS